MTQAKALASALALCAFCALSAGLAAQSAGAAASAVTSAGFDTRANELTEGQTFDVASGGERVTIAQSSPDYPVTPGDVYTLSFVTGAGPVIQNLVVDAQYGISLGNVGKLSGRGLAFPELQGQVERLVLAAYPLSSPVLLIKSVGITQVFLRGEVNTSGYQVLWGYSRLADLWGRQTTPYASSRAITIRSAAGEEAVYDLFRFWRDGERGQNPFLKAGDVVDFAKAGRIVTLSGEVRRPGSYQLLAGEGLRQLIEVYGDGFTPKALSSRLQLTRFKGSSDVLGQKSKLDYQADPGLSLENLDLVHVVPMQELLPVLYFEGALGVGIDGEDPSVSTRLVYTFYPGERLSQAVQAFRAKFSAVSDLERAYLERGTQKIPVNLASFIYNKDYAADQEIQPDDVVVVPFRQYFVTVSGAVNLPGRYPYIPDRGWQYYVNLAGGFDPEKHAFDALSIFDNGGTKRLKTDFLQPEDMIEVPANNLLYKIERYAGIITSALSVASVVLGVISIFQPQ